MTMKSVVREEWLEFWGGMVTVHYVPFESIPSSARYLCTERNDDQLWVDYYDDDDLYIYGVLES